MWVRVCPPSAPHREGSSDRRYILHSITMSLNLSTVPWLNFVVLFIVGSTVTVATSAPQSRLEWIPLCTCSPYLLFFSLFAPGGLVSLTLLFSPPHPGLLPTPPCPMHLFAPPTKAFPQSWSVMSSKTVINNRLVLVYFFFLSWNHVKHIFRILIYSIKPLAKGKSGVS